MKIIKSLLFLTILNISLYSSMVVGVGYGKDSIGGDNFNGYNLIAGIQGNMWRVTYQMAESSSISSKTVNIDVSYPIKKGMFAYVGYGMGEEKFDDIKYDVQHINSGFLYSFKKNFAIEVGIKNIIYEQNDVIRDNFRYSTNLLFSF